jgi:transposase
MTEKQDLRSRLVAGRKRDGRREFNEDAVAELVTLCLKPGVSIARTAMDHDVNPNQLRRWIARYQQGQILQAPRVPDPMVIDDVSIDIPPPTTTSPTHVSTAPAFVPVVSAPPASLLPPTPTSPRSSMTLTLHVRLPNGVEFDLGEANVRELTTIVQMLGRLECSGSTKD